MEDLSEVSHALPASGSAHLPRLVNLVSRPEEPAGVIPHGGVCEEREGQPSRLLGSLWCRGSLGDLASVQAVTRVNAEQSSKRSLHRPTRPPMRGRLVRLGK
jgi:hypothetical protein